MGKGSGVKEAVGKFKSSKNKKLNAKALLNSRKVKKTSYISAYNPETNQFINGNLTEVSKKLGTTGPTLKQRFSGGKFQFNMVKGFQVIPHKDLDSLLDYKTNLVKDVKVPKKKASPIFPGEAEKYFKKLYPEYKLGKGGSRQNKFWGSNEQDYNVNLQSNNLTENEITEIFAEVGNDIKSSQKLKSTDKIRIIINDPNLSYHISTQLLNVSDYRPDIIMKLIQDAHESSEEHFVIGPQTTISVVSINVAQNVIGSSSKERDLLFAKMNGGDGLSINEKIQIKKQLEIFNKKSIITIKNPNDELCCARAIMTAVFRNEYGTESSEYSNMRKGRPCQLEQALELHAETDVPLGPCGIPEIKIFEEYLGYQITIINGDFLNQVIYPDINGTTYKPPPDDSKTIYLYYSNNHYDLVASNRVAGFFCKDNFCHYCKKTYKKKGEHKCIFNGGDYISHICPLLFRQLLL